MFQNVSPAYWCCSSSSERSTNPDSGRRLCHLTFLRLRICAQQPTTNFLLKLLHCRSTYYTASQRYRLWNYCCSILEFCSTISRFLHMERESTCYYSNRVTIYVVMAIDVKNVFYVFYSCHVFNVF